MGGALQHSRQTDLPVDIDKRRNEIIVSWTEKNILTFPFTAAQADPESTLSSKILQKAAQHINTVFSSQHVELNILEVFAGNCCASQIIYNAVKEKVVSWICTDAINFDKPIFPNKMKFEQLHTVEAVNKFGQEANVLLLISPPPYPTPSNKDLGYGDYYACYDFLALNIKDRYIIFIGELGASDGSQGMYKYLTTHPNLDIIARVMLDNKPDVFGEPGEKELFIFQTK